VKELESQAGQVGHVHAMAFLRRISAADLADYMGNEGIRSQLRERYAAAVADVGEKKAMKSAGTAAYLHAERAILGAGVTRGYAPVLRAAERAVQAMLAEQTRPARG
jgi:hypothetical protein